MDFQKHTPLRYCCIESWFVGVDQRISSLVNHFMTIMNQSVLSSYWMTLYWVSQKKLLHKSEERMHKKWWWPRWKLKTWYMCIVQQHQGKRFCKKIFFFFLFIQLIWLFECLILTLTKCLQNLFKDSSLSVISITKKSPFQVVWIMLKMSKDNFFGTPNIEWLMSFYCLSKTALHIAEKLA